MNVVFVVQKGELALKGLLLAWSLRQRHPEARLFAAIPEYSDWGELSAEVRSALQVLGVKTLGFQPPFAPEYPIGNKVRVLGLLPAEEAAVFLDSDMLCLTAEPLSNLLPEDFSGAAKPADLATWGSPERWQRVYARLGVSLRGRKVRATVSGDLMLPYFNAGLVAVRQPQVFAQRWEAATRTLTDPDLDLGQRYPWLDQIALAPCLMSQGPLQVLNEGWNFPAHLKALPEKGVHLCHYHSPGVILREPRLRDVFVRACRALPQIERLAYSFPNWKPLLQPALGGMPGRSGRHDFLITGIPRSGTSFVAQLLDAQKNWVVLNEPREVFSQLTQRKDATGITLLHRQVREALLRGDEIENKVDAGRVINDTAADDRRSFYHPELNSANFRLGSKNTLAYMAALPELSKLGWPIVALVRHPQPTLRSWKRSFAHLREVTLDTLPVANPEYSGWQGWQRESIKELLAEKEAHVRRVLFWRMLARTLLWHEASLQLWKYEDILENPSAMLRRLRWSLRAPGSLWCTKESVRQVSAHMWEDDEREVLGDLCQEEMRAFGYELY
ncbi:sulfotransferase [Nitrincola tapanii]|nr:sulfotransferase [Nitrincola tapanii]